MKTEYEIELEVKLMKAWAETVVEKLRADEAVNALSELNTRVHSGYNFNADPDKISRKVGSVLVDATRQTKAVALNIVELVQEVAKEYPDAADWKDSRGKLERLANSILREATK